jgi:hypothetical protein
MHENRYSLIALINESRGAKQVFFIGEIRLISAISIQDFDVSL